MMKTELKPCPFCGGQPKVERGPTNPRDLDYMLAVRCQKCGEKVQRMTGGWTEKEETTLNELAAEWNSKQAHELKPCPFCGGEAELYRMKRDSRKRMGIYHMIATVKCTKCTAQVSQAGYCDERAIENAYHQWNRRAEDDHNG